MSERGAWIPASLAARRLGVCRRTVCRWMLRGVLRGKRVKSYRDGRRRWLVLRVSLEAFVEDRPDE